MGWLGLCGSSRLLFVRLLIHEEVCKPIESAFPCRAAILNPLFHHGKSFRFYAAGAHAANLLRTHQAALFEYLQMLHYGCQCDGQRFGQLRHCNRRLTQPLY